MKPKIIFHSICFQMSLSTKLKSKKNQIKEEEKNKNTLNNRNGFASQNAAFLHFNLKSLSIRFRQVQNVKCIEDKSKKLIINLFNLKNS